MPQQAERLAVNLPPLRHSGEIRPAWGRRAAGVPCRCRRWPIWVVLCSLFWHGAAVARSAGAEPGRVKNIILFVTDDQSPDAGCYGNPTVRTPHLDALAAEGVLFRQAFCTTASCSASRSVILSGLHNHANGQYGHQHAYHKFSSYPWVQTLPVMLARMGYRTARIGKHHNAPEEVYFFQYKLPGNARSPVAMANNCEAFLQADDSQPFFLFFATADPHRSGETVDDAELAANRFGNKAHEATYPGVTEATYDPRDVVVPDFLPDSPASRAEIAQYYQSISRIDQGLGRLVEILKARGKWENTLFVYTSDHGMAFPGAKTTVYEGGLRVPLVVRNPFDAARGHENSAMISFVDLAPTLLDFAGAWDPTTQTVREAALRDAAPSDRDARPAASRPDAGSPADPPRPYRLHGRSLLSIMNQRQPAGWDVIYASHTFHEITMYYPMRVVRDRRYKLIWNIAHPLAFPFASDLWVASTWQAQYRQGLDAPYGRCSVGEYIHRPAFEFYDLVTDPHETRNLASDPRFAQQLAEYKQQLKQFQKASDDPWILKWDYE